MERIMQTRVRRCTLSLMLRKRAIEELFKEEQMGLDKWNSKIMGS